MIRKYDIEGIGPVNITTFNNEYSLNVELPNLDISREIKFNSPDLLLTFFNSIEEVEVKEMALATVKNNIEEKLRKQQISKEAVINRKN